MKLQNLAGFVNDIPFSSLQNLGNLKHLHTIMQPFWIWTTRKQLIIQ